MQQTCKMQSMCSRCLNALNRAETEDLHAMAIVEQPGKHGLVSQV